MFRTIQCTKGQGIVKVKKIKIIRYLFLIKKKLPNKKFALIGMIMTKMHQIIFTAFFLENKYCQNHGQCSEKWASVRADFFDGENLDHPEKKALNNNFH